MILETLSTILGGIIIGTICAKAVPASFIVETTLFIGVGIMILSLFSSLRKKGRSSPSKKKFKTRSTSTASTSPDYDSDSTPESHGTAATATAAPPQDVPSNVTLSDTGKVESMGSLIHNHIEQDLAAKRFEEPALSPSCPYKQRLEQEKLRLSDSDRGHEAEVKSSSTSLVFRDAAGREIKYNLRPSRKKNQTTFLQVTIEGGVTPKKVRKIMFDNISNAISDGRASYNVPSKNITAVMKSLNLLCKITSVQLDCTGGVTALQKLLLTRYEVKNGGSMRKVQSCTSLSRRGSNSRMGSISERPNSPKASRTGSYELTSSFTLHEGREASYSSLAMGIGIGLDP